MISYGVLAFGTGLLLAKRMPSPASGDNVLEDDYAHWLTGIWISTTKPATTLVFLRGQTFVEFAPGYSGSYPAKYRLTPDLMFEARYPRGEEGEAVLVRSQFHLLDAGQQLIVPEGALSSKARKFVRLTEKDPWVAGQNPPAPPTSKMRDRKSTTSDAEEDDDLRQGEQDENIYGR